MSHAPAPAGRAGQARRARGRRFPGRDAGGHPQRDLPEADADDVPQPAGHGGRGTAPLLPGRRRGAHGRLRQDHAGPADGRGQREHPGHLRDRRADAARQLPRPAGGQRHRRVEVLGRRAGRAHRRLRAGRARVRHCPLPWPLHDDGHRLHHDLGRRGPRHDPARDGLHPGGRLGPLPDGRGQRPADRGHGLGGPHPGQDPHPRGVRGRGGHRARAGRLHQRVHPPDRDGRPGRRGPDPGRLRRDSAPGAVAGQRQAEREVPDGGLLLRRRAARPAGPAGHGAGGAAPRNG